MNYIAEIKAFYDRLELNPLPSPAIALWHALMSIANKTGWQQEFTVAVSVLALKSGLNAQAIKRSRNRLGQDGYIAWKPRGGNQSAVYEVKSLVVQNEIKNVPQFVPQSEPQSVPQCEPQYVPQSVPINKHKHKQNKDNLMSDCQEEASAPYQYQQVIDYLNQKAGTAYRGTSKDTRKHIKARFDDGYSLDDFMAVIDKKVAEWGVEPKQGEKDMRQYLRPSTLFGTKFEAYLNQQAVVVKKTSGVAFNQFKQNDYDFDALERDLVSNQEEV